jgi:hypothetical protein
MLFVTVLGGSVIAQPVSAAKNQAKAPSTVGNDISYPQCGKTLPSGQAFGIVGVTGGLATTENSCLAQQLTWAAASTGAVAAQPKVQLYVNTANPGEIIDQVTTWPTSGDTPYGACDGTNSLACSWQYGLERAQAQEKMFQTAAQTAGISAVTGDYTWWLDVETDNTWQSGSSDALARNRAALEGMTSHFVAVGAKVGVYSTNYQWGTIAGTIPSASNLYSLDSWMAGARTLRGAQANCKNTPLNPGGRVILSQYVSSGLDYDISCI